MLRGYRQGWNLRQLLYSTVITNNGKNNPKSLACLSRVVQRHSSTAQGPAEAGSDTSLDWLKNLNQGDEEHLHGPRGDWWWTGKKPSKEVLQRISNHDTHVSCLPQILLKETNQNSVQKYFDNSWLMTEVLFSGLQGEEAFYRPPYHHLRHPMMFYYGHPSSVYVNKLRVAGLIPKGIDPYFEEIFEVGVDEMRWDDISTASKDWPRVSEVTKYRRKTYETITNLISELYEKNPVQNITKDTPLWALMMGIEHEKIHVETSSVLMRELPVRLLRKPEFFPDIHQSGQFGEASMTPVKTVDYPENEMIAVKGGKVVLGRQNDEEMLVYGWDNEFGNKAAFVEDFECSKFKVSNGEFFEFVKAGGYREKSFWSKDGWDWRVYRNQKWPTFWVQRGPAGSHEYALRTIFEEIEMPWSWPVVVNYHEAKAFCNWKKCKFEMKGDVGLLSEAQHHCIRNDNIRLPLKKGGILNDPAISKGASKEANNHLVHGSESPVEALAANEKGFHDVFGNVWDWTEDSFAPFPGFEVHPYYDDFSTPCFDGKHNIIMGGSFMSCSGNGGNIFSRYHFRPHFFQHAGFRYVASQTNQGINEKVSQPNSDSLDIDNSYETSKLLDQYMALHYGQEVDNADETVKPHYNRPDHALNFAKRSAYLLQEIYSANNPMPSSKTRALDVGCAVGAATFALAETFDEAIGMDFSKNFVAKANEIKNIGDSSQMLSFSVPVQGSFAKTDIKAAVPPKKHRDKSFFLTGDATKLKELNLGKFDAILCANLLCRLPKPLNLLDDLPDMINRNGVVLFLSPYSWLEEFTEKEHWLQKGDQLSSEQLKTRMLSNGFRCVHEDDVPLIIREHERKYQYIISHALAFQKK